MRRRRLRILSAGLVALGALFPSAACAPSRDLARAQAAQLEVTGSHPIANRDDDRFLATACDGSTSADSAPLAIAGTAGATISVEVARQACAPDVPLPPATCHWRIEPSSAACAVGALDPVEGIGVIEGARGVLAVTLPPRTGVYDLSLQCMAGDGTVVLASPPTMLYATYGAPLFLAAEPAESWYRLAASWGCGFGTSAAEHDVLERMLAGLYDHGRENWRYGSFDPPANSKYQPYNEGGGWTSCPWQALAEDDACNFADCYEFSQVFEHVAATHGIGVFEPVADIGARAGGFLTRAGSAALDPAFAGNVDCTADGKCDGYVFNSHSIRFRDGVYYDATFNATYQSAGQFIATSAVHHEDHSVTLLDGDKRLSYEGEGYGRWPQYRSPTPPGAAARMTPMLDLVPAASVVGASVSQSASSLVINARINLDTAGVFAVRALLIRGDNQDAEAIPSSHESSPSYSSAILQGPGVSTVSLPIPYRAITAAGGAGAYDYRVEVFEARPLAGGARGHLLGALIGRYSATTEISREVLEDTADEPQVLGVELVDVRLVEGGPGEFTARFRLLVPGAGGYLLQARLSQQGRTLAYAGNARGVQSRASGAATVMLDLPMSIADLSAMGDAPVKLTAELIQKNDADAPYLDSIAFASFFLQMQGGTLQLLDANP